MVTKVLTLSLSADEIETLQMVLTRLKQEAEQLQTRVTLRLSKDGFYSPELQ